MFPRTLVAFALFASLCTSAPGQDLPTYADLVEKATEKLSGVEAWSADISMKMNMMGMAITSTGTTATSGEQQLTTMNMDMMGQPMTMRSVLGEDGVQWTDVNAMGQRQLMKIDMKALADGAADFAGMPGMMPGDDFIKDPSQILTQMAEMFDLTVTGEDEVEGTKVYVLEGKLKTGDDAGDAGSMMAGMNAEMMAGMGISMDPLRVSVGQEDAFVRGMTMGEMNGQPWMTMEFLNVNFDPEFDADTFSFSAPEGVEIMDMTQAVLQGIQADDSPKFTVGGPAPEFEAEALDGSTVKLSDYRGKVVLIDFWATWCGPCVKELPHVIETYQAFHDKGFDIIGISLDDERDALDRFMEKYSDMTWTQIYDGKGWESAIGVQYGVEAIPFTMLVDKDGNVVDTDLRGDALYSAVEELVGE